MDFLRIGDYRINLDKILSYIPDEDNNTIAFTFENKILEAHFNGKDDYFYYLELLDDFLEVEVEDSDEED